MSLFLKTSQPIVACLAMIPWQRTVEVSIATAIALAHEGRGADGDLAEHADALTVLSGGWRSANRVSGRQACTNGAKKYAHNHHDVLLFVATQCLPRNRHQVPLLHHLSPHLTVPRGVFQRLIVVAPGRGEL